VRVSTAVDALTVRLAAARDDLALAFLATPTDVFAVPPDAVAQSVRAYAGRSRPAKLLGRPLRTLSAGRLLQRAYVAGADPGINDSLVPQQGPELRAGQAAAAVAGHGRAGAGTTVSMNVAPPTRTRSVVKNRALAAPTPGAPLRRRGVRAGDVERAHGRAARARPAHRRRPRTSTRGRTRRTPPSTAGCGGRPTRRAARWGWPPCSASAPPAADAGAARRAAGRLP
jgi:hypothetical protein